MGIENHRESLDALHLLIGGSSDSDQWGAVGDSAPDWQQGVLTRLHALTIHDEIHYLSSAKLDTGDWDFVAFTPDRVVRVLVTNSAGDSVRFETVTFARASLQSLELLDVESIPHGDEPWPVDVNLIGHYPAGSVPLPLDRFASDSNKHDLSQLLQSLLEDVAA
jgi:hypothetical protein